MRPAAPLPRPLSVWLVLCALGLAAAGCEPPNFATVADVEAVLIQPRSDQELQALGDEGRRVFLRRNCQSCHVVEGTTRGGPRLANLYTTQAVLLGDRRIDRDRAYVIRSILQPQAEVVAGYPQQMTSFKHLPAEEVAALVAYLERYSPPRQAERDSPAGGLPPPQE